MKYVIIRDDERYRSFPGQDFPSRITTSDDCTLEQARKIAEMMTDRNPGCDRMFYVESDREEENRTGLRVP